MKGLLLLPLAGCAIGAGSAYTGQWRARDEVAMKACLVDESGNCTDRKQVIEHVPERKFWGVLVTFPSLGGAVVSHGSDHGGAVRIEPSLEVLWGRGRFAWGVRGSLVSDNLESVSLPATGLAHYSLTPHVGVYGGLGYSPYSRLHEKMMPVQTSFLAARAVAGVQLAFSRSQSETFGIVSFEADTMWIDFADSYRSTGFTGHIGVFF